VSEVLLSAAGKYPGEDSAHVTLEVRRFGDQLKRTDDRKNLPFLAVENWMETEPEPLSYDLSNLSVLPISNP
jgi:hypothetical protein